MTPGRTPSVALADVQLSRPVDLDGRVEVVIAPPAVRSFPVRVASTLGVCLKLGPAHTVRADGRRRDYPADSVCVRPPGCIWETENTGLVGFVSLDITLDDVDERGRMEFVPARALPDVRRLAHRLTAPGARLEKDEAVVRLIDRLADQNLLAALATRDATTAPHKLRRVREVLEASTEANPSLDEVALIARMNKHVLVRKFRDQFGVTPHAYLVLAKIDRARELLARGASVSAAAATLCFADQAHLSRAFRQNVGISPRAYQRSVRVTIP